MYVSYYILLPTADWSTVPWLHITWMVGIHILLLHSLYCFVWINWNHGMTSSANLDSSSAFLHSLLTGSNNAAWWQHASGLAGLTPNLFGSTLGTLGQTQDVASFQSLLKATGRSWCMNNTYLHLKLRDSQAESIDVGSVRSTLRWRQGRQGRMKHCMILK